MYTSSKSIVKCDIYILPPDGALLISRILSSQVRVTDLNAINCLVIVDDLVVWSYDTLDREHED